MILPTDIRSLSEFQRTTKKYIARLKKSGRPEVLTVNGEASVVIQDAAAYAKAMGKAKPQTDLEAVREGLAQMDAGQGRPWREVREELLREADKLGRRSRRRLSA